MKKLTLICAALLTACGGAQSEEPATAAEPESSEPTAETTTTSPPPAEDPTDVHIEGDHLTIDQMILFATDSDEILADSNTILDHLAQLLNNHSEFTTIRIIGHTDAAGGHDHNQDLSERRAAAVAAALTSRGVQQSLQPSGVGETEPVCEEDTDECHQQNRRVEFIVGAAGDTSGGEDTSADTGA